MNEKQFVEALENETRNIYENKDNFSPYPLIDVLRKGLINDEGLYIALKAPKELLKQLNIQDDGKGITIKLKEDPRPLEAFLSIGPGQGCLRLYTSSERIEGNNNYVLIKRKLSELISYALSNDDCLGIMINPGNSQMILNKDILGFLEYLNSVSDEEVFE